MVMEVHISNTDRVRGFLSAHATLIGFVSTILTISSQSFDFMENSCKEVMLEISKVRAKLLENFIGFAKSTLNYF